MSTSTKNTKKFDAKSPGFLYSVIVFILGAFAIGGIRFPDSPEEIANGIVTGLSASGVWSVIGIIVSSLLFPVINFVKQGGKITWSRIVGSTLVWTAFFTALFAGVALTGFVVPDGTAEQIVASVQMKDWGALLNIVVFSFVIPLIRFFKDKRAEKALN